MSNRYRVLVSFDAARSVHVARAPELAGAQAEGATRAEAVAKLDEEIEAQIANITAQGGQPPRAIDDDPALDGKLSVEISPALHRDLAFFARQDGVDPKVVLAEIVAAAVERRRAGGRGQGPAGPRPGQGPGQGPGERGRPGGGGGGRRGPGGRNDERYAHIMEDRASFMEYVRGLEQGGGGRGRPGGAPRPGGRPGGGRGGGAGDGLPRDDGDDGDDDGGQP